MNWDRGNVYVAELSSYLTIIQLKIGYDCIAQEWIDIDIFFSVFVFMIYD